MLNSDSVLKLLVFKTCKALLYGSLQAPKIATQKKGVQVGIRACSSLCLCLPCEHLAQVLRCQQSHGQGVWSSLSTDLVWTVWTPGSDSCSPVTSRCVAARFLLRGLWGIPILPNGSVVEILWVGVGTGVLQPGFVIRSGHNRGSCGMNCTKAKCLSAMGFQTSIPDHDFHQKTSAVKFCNLLFFHTLLKKWSTAVFPESFRVVSSSLMRHNEITLQPLCCLMGLYFTALFQPGIRPLKRLYPKSSKGWCGRAVWWRTVPQRQ